MKRATSFAIVPALLPLALGACVIAVPPAEQPTAERADTAVAQPQHPRPEIGPGRTMPAPGRLPTAAQPAAAPAVHSSGALTIPQTYRVDLDAGRLSNDARADLWFEAKTATDRYLVPQGGARIALLGLQEPGHEGCAGARLSLQPIPVPQLRAGTYLCVRTGEGRLSQLWVRDPVGPSPGELLARYTTWESGSAQAAGSPNRPGPVQRPPPAPQPPTTPAGSPRPPAQAPPAQPVPPAPSRSTIHGQITGPRANVIVQVDLIDEQERLVESVRKDASGSFRFENLPAGRYWVALNEGKADVMYTASPARVVVVEVNGTNTRRQDFWDVR